MGLIDAFRPTQPATPAAVQQAQRTIEKILGRLIPESLAGQLQAIGRYADAYGKAVIIADWTTEKRSAMADYYNALRAMLIQIDEAYGESESPLYIRQLSELPDQPADEASGGKA